MKRNKLKGVAIVEFSFAMLVMVPLLLGTIGFGLRLLQQMQTVQLARDAGRMYARPGMDLSRPGNQTILATVGADLGLKTDGTGKAVLILTTVTYIDKGMCPQHDVSGNPINCPNYKSWVFHPAPYHRKLQHSHQQPRQPADHRPRPVTVNPTTGMISSTDQINNPGDVATFASGNPFVSSSRHVKYPALGSGAVCHRSRRAGFRDVALCQWRNDVCLQRFLASFEKETLWVFPPRAAPARAGPSWFSSP